MKKFSLLAISTILIFGFSELLVSAQPKSFRPKNGFVPNQETAVRIGEAVLSAIYGEKQIASEHPFSARLKNGIWTVAGSFPRTERFGGVAQIKISKSDGCIISVAHGQ